ncbi:MAG: 4-(cytidine 5'-diphospho)-2-C-methyl-D-erythritol kinase [Candidatus Acidiferrales bacterium]
MPAITIPAFAKVNLRLHIVGKRPDGYHELRTIFQTISLHDRLTIQLLNEVRSRPKQSGGKPPHSKGAAYGGIEFECNDPALPADRGNLAWRALDALRHELKLKAGIHARLEKWIPAGRGLGGGSSDAAAALIGLLHLAKRASVAKSAGLKAGATSLRAREKAGWMEGVLPRERLLEIAASLGADVPFFLLGGRALGIGRGDEIYPLDDIPPQTLLVVSPADIMVPTPDAYAWFAERMKKVGAPRPVTARIGDAHRKHRKQSGPDASGHSIGLTNAAEAHKLVRFCALCSSSQGGPLANDFEPAVFAKHPRLSRIKRELLRAGATDAALAGSGSAVFGFFPNPARARRAARKFPYDQVFLAETVSRIRYRKALGM